MMKFVEIKKKEDINNFVSAQKHSQFLQSWEWGGVQEKFGNKVLRYGLYDGGKLKFAMQLIKISLPLGMAYFYAPRIGIKYLSEKELEFLFFEIKKLAKKERAIFLRFEPRTAPSLSLPHSCLAGEGTCWKITQTIDVQASKTLILDISGSEEDILKQMHSKSRYNIRLAEKKDVVIREGNNTPRPSGHPSLEGNGNGDFEKFWRIMEETKERDGFRLHAKEYYKKMIDLENIKLLVAEYENEIIAGIIVSYFGDMGVYVHGASSNKYRNVMAPYLLQWEAIKLAKDKGCTSYDFNGIDEKKWPGVTRFKLGFGGEVIQYPGTFDMMFSKKYYFYKILRKVRRVAVRIRSVGWRRAV